MPARRSHIVGAHVMATIPSRRMLASVSSLRHDQQTANSLVSNVWSHAAHSQVRAHVMTAGCIIECLRWLVMRYLGASINAVQGPRWGHSGSCASNVDDCTLPALLHPRQHYARHLHPQSPLSGLVMMYRKPQSSRGVLSARLRKTPLDVDVHGTSYAI